MNNKKYYPFERNNYFYGKLLTVRDFEEEQRYLNDKRRISNVLTNGCGIVAGLDIVQVDEKTISIESGMAIDFMGREIIIDEPISKKLNMIEGFEQLDSESDIYLCVEYNEELNEEVYGSVIQSNKDYNRVKEGYRIFLTNAGPRSTSGKVDKLVENKVKIYESQEIVITQTIPRYVNPNRDVDIVVEIEKQNLPKHVEVDYIFSSEFFCDEDGNNSIRVYYKDDEINTYSREKLVFKVRFQDLKNVQAPIVIKSEDVKVNIGNVEFNSRDDIKIVTEIIEESLTEKLLEKYYELDLEDLLSLRENEKIYLAKILLIKEGKYFTIDRIKKAPFNQYILNNELLQLFIKYSIKDNKENLIKVERDMDCKNTNNNIVTEERIKVSNGAEIIEISSKERNVSYFSPEISHGLGTGDVYIKVGFEDMANEDLVNSENKVIFGDSSVFEDSYYEANLPKITHGIILYKDKGTFRVGIKPIEKTQSSFIKLRWWAIKDNKSRDISYTESDRVSIKIEPNMVVLSPREKFKFRCIIDGTDNKECRWSVKEKNGGEIDINGIYEAPSLEGVFEIVAESVKYPNKKASIFVIVKEK